MLKNILKLDLDAKQIQKAINSLKDGKRGIKTHLDKIANPSKYVEGWDVLRQSHKDHLIEGWRKEIQNASEQIDILSDLLNKK